jgi:hypothetical protein
LPKPDDAPVISQTFWVLMVISPVRVSPEVPGLESVGLYGADIAINDVRLNRGTRTNHA